MSNIAIIPARGGSKRLPRKNILPFMGKPMLIWTCEAALKSQCFDTIVVSTEDEEIADITEQHGFSVNFRSKDLASDAASCAQVCLDVLKQYQNKNISFVNICCLYATAPLRTAVDIKETLALLDQDTDFAFATCEYSNSPYQALTEDANHNLNPIFPLLVEKKSQELAVPYIDNGSTYAAKVEHFFKTKGFRDAKLKGYLMPKIRSIDIDTHDDYLMAQACALFLNSQKG